MRCGQVLGHSGYRRTREGIGKDGMYAYAYIELIAADCVFLGAAVKASGGLWVK